MKWKNLLRYLKSFMTYCQCIFNHVLHRRNNTEQIITSDKKALDALPHNPYLQSKVLWNDMYGSLQVKLENSYRILIILSFVILCAVIGLVILAGESKIVPYVTVIHGDELITLDRISAYEKHTLQPKLAFFFTKNFIRYARSVSADGDVNAENRMASYAFVGGAAVERLKAFYAHHDPDTIARHVVKEIHITSVLRTSTHTMEIRWREISRAVHSGTLQDTHTYSAQLHYQFRSSVSDPRILRVNPLGFTITQLSWSKDDIS